MARYKLSKKNIYEFFNIFGKKKKPKPVEDLIKSDPVLKKLDKEIGDLNKKATKHIKRDKEYVELLKKYGINVD